MRKSLILLIPLSFAAATLYAQNAEEAAIREVVHRYAEARDTIDAHAIESLFTADADQLVSSGEWRKGRPAVVRGTVASSKKESGKRTIALASIRFLDHDVAIGDAHYDVGARHMWSSFVFKREPGGWRIAAIRNMLPSPPAR
jgi:uncharacterized protein (TIGR02246 family)